MNAGYYHAISIFAIHIFEEHLKHINCKNRNLQHMYCENRNGVKVSQKYYFYSKWISNLIEMNYFQNHQFFLPLLFALMANSLHINCANCSKITFIKLRTYFLVHNPHFKCTHNIQRLISFFGCICSQNSSTDIYIDLCASTSYQLAIST